jgi:hypothetical protein
MTTVSIILLVLLTLVLAAAAAYGLSMWRAGRGFLSGAAGIVALFITFVLVSTLTTAAITAWFQ